MQAKNLVFKNVVEIHFFVMYFTVKDVPTSNSHILVVLKGSQNPRNFNHEQILVRSQTFIKHLSRQNPRILRNLGLKLVPFVRMENKCQLKSINIF